MTESQLLEQKISSRIGHFEGALWRAHAPIGPWRTRISHRYLDGGIPKPDESWESIQAGYIWLPDAEARWFIGTAVVPSDFRGGPLVARLQFGGEAQVFVNGKPAQSLHPGRGEMPPREEVLLAEGARPGERYEVAVEATRYWYPLVATPQTFSMAELAIPNLAVRDFVYWLRVTLEAAFALQNGSTERLRLVRLLDQAITEVNLHQAGTDEFDRAVAQASANLQRGLAPLAPSAADGKLTIVGHAHIDTAWLWPLAETHRKCGRTFSNVLSLMDQYPGFVFSQSQPQLYKFTKQLFPELYEGIKRRIAEGRWEVIGGAWVECDCNVSGGEALIRQLLYGKRFLRQEFGKDTKVGWWPDAFGYTWSLPQILAHCGMESFFTTKLSWNQYNEFPYGLFWWQGIDGTRVLAQAANSTYNGNVSPGQLASIWRRFPERDRVDEYLYSFGYGDGGGGPTAQMIEYGRRLSAMPGVPKVRFGRADEYVERVSKAGDSLPVWNGELYLELHRGCQTTQARTKRGNRKLELLLREVEQWSALAGVHAGAAYPREQLQGIWERLLCLQFHDILPGSSVRQVYVEAEQDYARMMAEADGLRASAVKALAGRIDTRGEGQAVAVFNSLSWERTGLVEVKLRLTGDSFEAVSPSGERGPCQVVSRSEGAVVALFLAKVPALGHTVYHIVPANAPAKIDGAVEATADRMENGQVRLSFDGTGRLTSVFDEQANREALAPGASGNLLQYFDDRPHNFDAWDIDPWFTDQSWEAPAGPVEVVEAGPLRAAVRQVRQSKGSTITQDIRMYAHSRRVDFVTSVDWHEKHTLLKVAFPVDILSPQAMYEIQFGAIARPTHDNTTWDRAKFEVPAQRWADLSEEGYGVALLNDCKYGYDVKGNVLRLSLLRSPTDPDPEADEGRHEFTYALYPHMGSWQSGGVVRQGLELNVPMVAVAVESHEGGLSSVGSAAQVDQPGVIVETMKRAEDGDELILRVYEAHGRRGRANIKFGLPVESVVECNGMEEETARADYRDGVLRLDMRPWQIRTFRVGAKRS